MKPVLLLALLAATVCGAKGLSLQEIRALKKEGNGEKEAVEEDEDEESSKVEGDQELPKAWQQVITMKNPGKPDDGSILAIDYEKSLAGLYDAERKRCFLIGGVNQKMLDINDPKGITYATTDDFEVKDKSLLPDAIKSECLTRPVDWMERDESEDEIPEMGRHPIYWGRRRRRRKCNIGRCRNSTSGSCFHCKD